MNAAVRAQNLIDLMRELTGLLERENEILKRPREVDLKPLVDEKRALFRMYDEHMIAISKDPGFAASLGPDIKEELRAASLRFEEVARANEKRLGALVNASRQIVSRITEAAKRAAGHIEGYARDGETRGMGKAAPIAVNRTF